MPLRLRPGMLFALALAGLRAATAAEAVFPATPEYILFLTADGFRTDYIEWFKPPHLMQLIAEGVRVTDVACVFPTVTTPNMASIATGSFPRTTGVASNTQYVPEEDRIVRAPRPAVETIAGTLRKAGWVTGAVGHFMLQPAVEHYAAPGYTDAEKTTDAVIDFLQHKGARFVGAIYGVTDQAGHQHGPESAQVREAVAAIDRALGRLVAFLKERGLYEQTLITFNSDHGMSAFEKRQASIEPARALAEAGFRVGTSVETVNAETQIVVLDAGVRMVYFRALPAAADRQRAEAILRRIEGVDVLGKKELAALGCHENRSGDLIVSPRPGFAMSNAGKAGGLHGRFAERNPILFFRGPGVRRGATVPAARTVDIVPTVLRAVNVAPAPTVEGDAIRGALRE
jgi:predicted AlkP superfamily pyrophosphatase or phosphodiesterase